MTRQSVEALDDVALARLLSLRLARRDSEAECPELAVVSAVLSGQGGPEELVLAGEHVRACERCGLAVRERRSALTVREPARDAAGRSRPWLSPRPLAWAGAAVAVVVATVVLWQPPDRHGRGSEDDRFAIKGGGDAVQVAVQRGPTRFRLRPGQGLEDGDQLGFFYSAARPGYLALLSAGQDGQVTVLFPREGPDSAPITAGAEVPLPDGGVFRRRAACEWLVGVFSDQPLALASVVGDLRRAAREAGGDCGLAFSAPGARNVSIVR